MAKLTAAQRNKLASTVFGLPSTRQYPLPDKAHAKNAKARASEEFHKGHLTKAQLLKIDAKANRVLAGKSPK